MFNGLRQGLGCWQKKSKNRSPLKKISWEYTHNILRWHSITISHYGDEEDDAAEAAKMKQEIDAEHAAGDFHRMYYEKESKVSE